MHAHSPRANTTKQEMLARSAAIFERVRRGEAEAWAELEKELVLEFEYTSWPILSDETLGKLTQVRLFFLLLVSGRVCVWVVCVQTGRLIP